MLGRQPSARPHHDWNERITSQCYRPNARARILGDGSRIIDIVNNYAKISFNFGPTLLSWLETEEPRVYQAILESDRLSRARFSGHGSAIAQAYNHIILPLANDRDKKTQIVWGIRDFEKRFGRKPEGMWLAETAADTPSLEALAEEGIAFTILSPRQAKSVRAPGDAAAKDSSSTPLDTERPYKVLLPSGRSIAVFFYDGGLSQAVAFERLLSDGAGFAKRLMGAFRPATTEEPRLVHIATDGETYGHHHPFGEMALAWACHSIESSGDVRLTNYAELLSMGEPTHVAEIVERSSWSCFHGVGRWSADCGCRMRAGSSQAWRGPLRESLDWLRDEIDALFEAAAKLIFKEPWGARDAYIDVVLDRSATNVDRFLAEHGARPLSDEETVVALELMELQRFRMLMFTSCGWFFDDAEGLETTQILEYAARAIELSEGLGGRDLRSAFAARLAPAVSEAAFARIVRSGLVDTHRIAAHVAIASLVNVVDAFESRAHDVTPSDLLKTASLGAEAGLATGRVKVRHRFTRRESERSFIVLQKDGIAFEGVTFAPGERAEEAQAFDELHALARTSSADALRSVVLAREGRRFESLEELLPDAQGTVLSALLEGTMARIDRVLHEVHDECAPLLKMIAPLAVDPPKLIVTASKLVLQAEMVRLLEKSEPDFGALKELARVAREEDVHLDLRDIEHRLRAVIDRVSTNVENGGGPPALIELQRAVDFATYLFTSFDLSRAQDLVWTLWEVHKTDDLAPLLSTLANALRLALPGQNAVPR